MNWEQRNNQSACTWLVQLNLVQRCCIYNINQSCVLRICEALQNLTVSLLPNTVWQLVKVTNTIHVYVADCQYGTSEWGFIDLFFVILSLCVLFLTPDNCVPCSQRCARVFKIGTNKSRILGLVSDNWRDISRPSIMLSSWGASKLITAAVVHAIVCVVYLETATEAFPVFVEGCVAKVEYLETVVVARMEYLETTAF